jgi:hypothetical protein
MKLQLNKNEGERDTQCFGRNNNRMLRLSIVVNNREKKRWGEFKVSLGEDQQKKGACVMNDRSVTSRTL